ncbi:MAG: hypothetical protein M3Y53_04190 [Thermoproteota archaeon]|nr:hypothetical protein [Thermoproteota archaeon]
MGFELAGFEVDSYNDSATPFTNFKPNYYDLNAQIDGFELYERIRKIDDM